MQILSLWICDSVMDCKKVKQVNVVGQEQEGILPELLSCSGIV